MAKVWRNFNYWSMIWKIKERTRKAASCCYSVINQRNEDFSLFAKSIPDHITRPSYALDKDSRHPIKQKKIDLKNEEQLGKLRDACRIATEVLEETSSHIQPGITTDELDTIAHKHCVKLNAYPSPLLYKNFPKSICTSVNEVACHGIPSDLLLKEGDIINLDVTVYFGGYHGDLSATYPVGTVTEEDHNLIQVAEICRDDAITVCGPGVPLNEIGNKVSEAADLTGYNVIPYFTGHGIGEYFHGLPEIIHVENDDHTLMEEGMTFTIEPIISAGGSDIVILDDKWTVVSKDKSRSAQFEHTVAITSNGVEILTAL